MLLAWIFRKQPCHHKTGWSVRRFEREANFEKLHNIIIKINKKSPSCCSSCYVQILIIYSYQKFVAKCQ